MRFTVKATRGEILAFLFVILLVAPGSVALTHKIRSAIVQDEVMKMKMKTICVGRFLIDIPNDALVSFRPAGLSGWSISTDPNESNTDFFERLQENEKKIREARNQNGKTSLESITPVQHGKLNGKIFEFNRNWTSLIENNKKVTIEDVSVNGHIRINDLSFNFTAKGTWPGHSKLLAQLISQFKTLKDDELPTEPGFCFDHGIIVDPITAEQGESVVMFVGLKDHPDVSIALDSHAGIDPQESLLERDDKNDVRLRNLSHFHTFRRGALKIAGIQGEELLERISESNGTASQSFTWESITKKDDVFTPFLTLEFSTGHSSAGGKPVNSSLSDAAALALWDRMLSSLRVRPTKTVKPAALVAPPPPPLGTVVLANQACPASGWWRCGDDDVEVQGGAVKYLRAGERVPQTVLLVPQTVWQRVRGKRSTFQRSMASHWTLVNRRQRQRIATAPAGLQAAAPDDADDERTPAPVGTLADSGQPCPESGWWLCADTEALAPGSRWFGRGEILPRVSFKTRRSRFEWLKGYPAAVMQGSATWKLARHADMPALPPDDTDDSET